MKNSTTLFEAINDSQFFYKWFVSLSICLVLAFVAGILLLDIEIKTSRKIIQSVSSQVSTLISSNDRADLMRLLSSLKTSEEVDIFLTQDGKVFANSGDVEELDSLVTIKKGLNFNDFQIFSNRLVVGHEVRDHRNMLVGKLFYQTKLETILARIALVVMLVFFLTYISTYILEKITKSNLKKALFPLKQLEFEIKSIAFNNVAESRPINISELESVRETILKSKMELVLTQERLALVKAKELNAESYKRLIHDIHNPIFALNMMIQTLNSITANETSKEEARSYIPEIAQEILMQITSAKKNLEFDSSQLSKCDIKPLIEEILLRISETKKSKAKLIKSISNTPMLTSLDQVMIKRAVINLIENGLEACRDCVEVNLTHMGSYISLKVSDDGPGVTDLQLSNLFKGNARSGKADRPAFGFSSANHVIRNHGGEIVYSTSNMGGACFEIRLNAT